MAVNIGLSQKKEQMGVCFKGTLLLRPSKNHERDLFLLFCPFIAPKSVV